MQACQKWIVCVLHPCLVFCLFGVFPNTFEGGWVKTDSWEKNSNGFDQWAQFEFSEVRARFFPKLFTHIAYFHCRSETTKTICQKCHKQELLGPTILALCWHFHIFTRSHTLRGSTSRKSLLHKFSGQFSRQQVGRGWKCVLSLLDFLGPSTRSECDEYIWIFKYIDHKY